MCLKHLILKVWIRKVFPQTNPIKVALEETYRFNYIYPKAAEKVTNSFGVGIRHTLGLVRKNDKLMIAYDWYTDCFEDALQYAHKYCGAANGEGNNFKYNKKYPDFNGEVGIVLIMHPKYLVLRRAEDSGRIENGVP